MFTVDHRDPKKIMTLSRLGSFHQSKLSFLRSFIREFKNWKFERVIFDLSDEGYGSAVYSVKNGERTYSLICFANELKSDERSDRVIATKWDAAFVLHDGVPTQSDLDRLRENVPKQEVGRVSYKELTLSRANKSVRIFDHVVQRLAQGMQPDSKMINDVGYLYRTTAVYGSGKFGLADRYRIKDRPEICGPFRLEMMLVYLVRQFTFDQVNHIAKCKNPEEAVELSHDIARNLGIGNSTGLGMAPFIVNHPTLLHNWIFSREEALRQIRQIENVSIEDFEFFKSCLDRSKKNVNSWITESEYQNEKVEGLKQDLEKLDSDLFPKLDTKQKYLWNTIYDYIELNLSDEGVEYVVSMMMEPYDSIIEPLVAKMSSEEDQHFDIPGEKTVSELLSIVENHYSKFLDINFDTKESVANFWFISKNKEEPRIANRYEENGSDLEQPLAIARDIAKLYKKLKSSNQSSTVAEFLLLNQDVRHVVRRCFIVENFPYSEIQDNTIDENLVPIDMLRLKLSFFGAQKFDPKSDKWLRINMYQGAPLIHELNSSDDTWMYDLI